MSTERKESERSIQDRFELIIPGSPVLSVPNYTAPKWFEADRYNVSRALYSAEYEIKTTVSDFGADARKRPQWGDDRRTKHERLAAGDTVGPNRFYFVTPEGLVPLDRVPIWAGLIYVPEDRRRRGILIRRAPMLHREQIPISTAVHAGRILTFRFWSERAKNNALRAELSTKGRPHA